MKVATLFRTTALAAFAFAATGLMAQRLMPEAKQNISYTFQSPEGTNASSVAWVPSLGAYITGIAGNPEFPMETFSSNGKPLAQYAVGVDMRGLWASKKGIMVNCAGEEGYYSIKASELGDAYAWKLVRDGQNQPDFQSVLNPVGKQLVGYANGELYYYKTNGTEVRSVPLSGYSGSFENLNLTTVGTTGVSAYPLVLLDFANKRLEFFSIEGDHLGSCALPSEAVTSDMFRFAFANRMAWLYDVDTRTWTAYRVFQD